MRLFFSFDMLNITRVCIVRTDVLCVRSMMICCSVYILHIQYILLYTHMLCRRSFTLFVFCAICCRFFSLAAPSTHHWWYHNQFLLGKNPKVISKTALIDNLPSSTSRYGCRLLPITLPLSLSLSLAHVNGVQHSKIPENRG